MCHSFFQLYTSDQKLRKKQFKALRKRNTVISDDVKLNMIDHQKQYLKSREPLLKGITSEFDLKMFRDAKAKACEDLVSYF